MIGPIFPAHSHLGLEAVRRDFKKRTEALILESYVSDLDNNIEESAQIKQEKYSDFS